MDRSSPLQDLADIGAATSNVAILLCTYNGAEFLKEQLDSIVEQTHSDWIIYASDDGSSDDTLNILESYQSKLGEHKLKILPGPRKGFAKNFMSLVKRMDVKADYFAFSDQDDIWFKDKLARSIAMLNSVETAAPALYCSRTRLINSQKKLIGYSPRFSRPPSFRNSLVQSIAGANTMLINNAARRLLSETDEDAPIVTHDWLAYFLIAGSGGTVVYDPKPTLDYRQHSGNLIGANSSAKDRLIRLSKMFTGRFRDWSDQNLTILARLKKRLTNENQITLGLFVQARRSTFLERLILMRKAGVYRQTLKGNISLIIAAGLNKI